MNNKSMTIGVLSVTAVILFIAQFLPVQPVQAEVTLKDRDYSIVTALSEKGGENLYVTDNRSGQVAVFVWDAGRRAFVPAGGIALPDAFR